MEDLLDPGNRSVLRGLMLYHMLGQDLSIDEFKAGDVETLLDGAMVSVAVDPMQFNDATVETGDIGSCNGIIHVIDDVLLPEVIGKLSVHDRNKGLTICLKNRRPRLRLHPRFGPRRFQRSCQHWPQRLNRLHRLLPRLSHPARHRHLIAVIMILVGARMIVRQTCLMRQKKIQIWR